MLTHEELQALARAPELVDGKDELLELVRHLRECTDCAKNFKSTLELENQLSTIRTSRIETFEDCISCVRAILTRKNRFIWQFVTNAPRATDALPNPPFSFFARSSLLALSQS
jgi:hypothetical protein